MERAEERIPPEYRKCPNCHYDLTGTIASGVDRCPECGRRFTLLELRMRGSNPGSMPASMPEDEWRVSGRTLTIALLGLVAVAGTILLVILISTGWGWLPS